MLLERDYITNLIIKYFGTFDHFYDIIEEEDYNYQYCYFRNGDQHYLVNDIGEILTWYKHMGRCTYFTSSKGTIEEFLNNLED